MPSGYPSNAAYPAALTPLDPKVTADNGGDFAGLLQPEHQAAHVASTVAYDQTVITAIIAALVNAGIMKAS